MNKKSQDQMSMMKMQDMVDIFYKLNRIRDNYYYSGSMKGINDVTPVERAENLIRLVSENNSQARQNAEIFIDILKNMEMLNTSRYNNKINMRTRRNSTSYGNDIISKIKFFLNSLNDEEWSNTYLGSE